MPWYSSVHRYAYVHTSSPAVKSNISDSMQMHSIQLISLGLFYMNFCDAIKEGDGHRVLRTWKYLLPMFITTRRSDYTKEAFLFLSQQVLLSSRLSEQMLCSRFVNVKGVRGGNIPADLHNEHLNKLCKQMIKALGSNKTEVGVIRASRALGMIEPILRQFDHDDISLPTGRHTVAAADLDRRTIISELIKYDVLEFK